MAYQGIMSSALFGAIIAGLSRYLIDRNDSNRAPWKIFSFLWAAPILLFIPVYISYISNKERLTQEFLYHALIGSSFTTFVIIFTLFVMRYNVLLALLSNITLSYLIIIIYFKYRIYEKL